MENLFDPKDLLALLGTALFLILIYNLVKNPQATIGITSTVFSGVNNSFKTLMGN